MLKMIKFYVFKLKPSVLLYHILLCSNKKLQLSLNGELHENLQYMIDRYDNGMGMTIEDAIDGAKQARANYVFEFSQS